VVRRNRRKPSGYIPIISRIFWQRKIGHPYVNKIRILATVNPTIAPNPPQEKTLSIRCLQGTRKRQNSGDMSTAGKPSDRL
jgi:hypothetical protein